MIGRMALDRDARRRYARHLLLSEVGEAGQERLRACTVALAGDARAKEVAALYLARAGVELRDGAASTVDAGSTEAVAAIAGRAELEEAASFLAGAFAAVEAIKAALDVGAPGRLDVCLSGPAKERA